MVRLPGKSQRFFVPQNGRSSRPTPSKPVILMRLPRVFNPCESFPFLYKPALVSPFKSSGVLRTRHKNMKITSFCKTFTRLSLASAFAAAAFAGNTWDGGGATDNWSDNANWNADGQPAYGTLTFSGSTRTTNVVDQGYSMNQLLWAGTSSWIVNNSGGFGIALFDSGGAQAKIENQSTGLVTINAPITFAANNASPPNPFGEINAVNGDITFGSGTLTVNGSSVNGIKMFGAGRTTTFNNTVSATGKWFGLTSTNTTMAVGGSFTSGDIYVMNSGTLKLNSGGAITTSALRLGGDFGNTGNQNQTLGGTLQFVPLTGGLTFGSVINSVSGNTSAALLIDSLNTSGTNTISGNIFLDSNLAMQQASGGTLAITNATLDLKAQTLSLRGSGGIINITGIIGNSTGSGQLVVGTNGTAGGPTATLSSASTYSGDTFVRAGTLAFTSAGSIANSTIRLGSTSGTSVDANVNFTTTTGSVTISSTINPVATSGSGVLTLNSQNTSGTNTYSGHIGMDRDFTINQSSGGTLSITSVHTAADTTNVLGTDIKGFTLTFGGAGTITVSGATSGNANIYSSTGTGSIIKTGTGTLNLTGFNTYAGTTTIQQGTLGFTQSTSLGTNAVTIGSGSNTASLVASGSAVGTVANAITLASGASAGTLTISSSTGTNSATFSGGINLNGDNLTVANNSTVSGSTSAGNLTFSTAAISGTGNLIVNNSSTATASTGGAGNVTISGGITNTGNLTLNNNSTSVGGAAGSITISTTNVTTSGTITNSGTGVGGTTISSSITNASAIVTQNSATSALTLSNANTYGGGTNVLAGTLNVGNSSAAGTSANTITLSNGTTLNVTNSTTFLTAGITLTGASANATLTSANATGGFNDAFTGTSGQTLTIGGTTQVNFGSSNTQQLSGFAGTVSVLSPATLRFSNSTLNNGGSGTTFDVAGRIVVRNGGAVALGALTGAGTIAGPDSADGTATFTIGAKNVASSAFTGTITNGSTAARITAITKTGTGTQTLSGASTYTGATTVTGGTLKAGIASVANVSGAFGLNSAVSLSNTAGVILDITGFNTQIGSIATGGTTGGNVTLGTATLSTGGNNTSTSYAGVISGTGGSLIKFGTGNQTLTNINTYTGGTTVNDAGTLTLARVNAGNDGNGAIRGTLTINSGATVVASQLNQLGYSAGIETTALNINGGTFNNTSSGDQGWGTTVNLTGGTLTTNGGTSSNTATSLFVLGKYTGGAAAVNTFASATTSTIGGRLNMDVSVPNEVFTVADGAAATDLLISAAMTERNGAVGITKAGAGNMTLTGANTYTGTTTISAGILNIQSNTGLGTTAGGTSVSNGATLQLQGNITVGAEALSLNGGAASGQTGALVNVSGTNTYGGAITVVASSSISAASGSVLNLTGGVIKNGTTATFNGGGTINVSGTGISGSAANSDLVVDGVTVNENVANDYNGPTFIRNAGVLNANVANALPTANGRTAVTMDDSGSGSSNLTLGASQSAALLTGAATSTIALGSNTLTVGASSGSTTFAGIISGTGGNLIKDGASTQVLSGANTFSGTTTISNGTLEVAGASALGSTSGVSVNNGGTLLLNTTANSVNDGASVGLNVGGAIKIANTISGLTEQMGALTLSGNSTLDFGTGGTSGAQDTLRFTLGSYALGLLTINGWDGTPYGGSFDHLVFGSALSQTFLDNIAFSGFGQGATQIALGGGAFEIVPIPEPSTLIGALGLFGMIGFRESRRTRRG